MDEFKLHKQRSRGAEAKRLWENSMIQEFFTTMENEIKNAVFDSKGEEAELRERAYLMMRLLGNLKQGFKSFMYTGEIAHKELLEIERDKAKGQG